MSDDEEVYEYDYGSDQDYSDDAMEDGGEEGNNGKIEKDPELYTEKAWEGISKLPQYAEKYKSQMVEAIHLLYALYDEGNEGLTQRILNKVDYDKSKFEKKIEEYVQKQPKVSDVSQKSIGRTLELVLIKAKSIFFDLN